MEKERRGPKIDASVVNSLLRQEWAKLATKRPAQLPIEERKLLAFAATIVSDLTDGQILAIAKGDAELVGNTHDGVWYKQKAETPACPRCGAKLCIDQVDGKQFFCPGCPYVWRIA